MFTFPMTMMSDATNDVNLLNGLIAWWSMDEASGNRADSHTGGLTLTQVGTVGSTTGKVGNAATGFSSSNYLSSSNAEFNFTDTLFYGAVWVRSSSFDSAETVLAKWKTSTNERSYVLNVNSGTPAFEVSSDGTFVVGTTTEKVLGPTISSGAWNFLEFYHDPNNDLIGIAVNGSDFTTQAWANGVYNASSINLLVGVLETSTIDRAFSGSIDNLVVYNRIPNSAERAELYNNDNGVEYPV